MKVFRGLGEVPKNRRPTGVTIGNFYAVHRGHKTLLRRAVDLAREVGGPSTVVTFEPHPGEVLHGEKPELLITAERKLELLEAAGIDQALILPFDKRFSQVEPEEFVERVLIESLEMKALVVGANFRFGHYARGDATMLRSYARQFGFLFHTARLAQVARRSISSTAIRHALHEGDLDWANKALGRPYSLPGKVVAGTGRGRKLGYPTANLRPVANLCVPGAGIYAGHFIFGADRRPAAISIGTNPTFGPGPSTVEAFLIDFSGALLGRRGEIEFTHRLRDHVRFAGTGALREAISEDVEAARRLLRTGSARSVRTL